MDALTRKATGEVSRDFSFGNQAVRKRLRTNQLFRRKIDAMSDTVISVIDLAAQNGLLKQSVFKVIKRLGIEPTKRLGANSRGQTVAYITRDEARAVVEVLRPSRGLTTSRDDIGRVEGELQERGVFYLLALEPKSDPGRFKVGFAASLPERLRQLRCSAPFAEVIATWPCKRLWERTAIECVADTSERLHTEVFRADSLVAVREKCNRFFAIMPKIAEPGGAANRSQPVGSVANRTSAAAGSGD